jgi:DNA invertase Pin-like site-specific DNA recombinase
MTRALSREIVASRGCKSAVGYLRRSTSHQEQSIDDQKKTIQVYASLHGFELLDFYVDDAISGASSEGRASFLKLIDDAKGENCPFQFVLVYDVKRFGRVDNDEAGFYRYQLRKNGIEIIYVSEGFNGDDTDDLLRPVKQWQARQELKDLSKVIIRGLLTRSEGGWWMGGTPPFGYDLAYYSGSGDFIGVIRFMEDGTRQMLDKDGNLTRTILKGDGLNFTKKDRCRLVLSSPERVNLIQTIFNWYLSDGLGYRGIADKLNSQGIKSPRGGYYSKVHKGMWATTTIMGMLQNPVYTGDMVWNKLTMAKFHRISEGRAVTLKGIPSLFITKNNPEDLIVHKDAHPAIISRSQFEQIQSKRKATAKFGYANSYRCGNGAKSPYLLTGLIKCSHCGHKWTGFKEYKGRKKPDGSNIFNLYYACGGYFGKGKSVCSRSLIPKDMIEDFVMDTIGAMIAEYFGGDNITKLRKLIEEEVNSIIPNSGNEIDQVEWRLAEIAKTINNLIDNMTSVNREFVDKRIIELKREKIEVEGRMVVLKSEGKKRIDAGAIIDEAMAMAADYRRVFDEGTVEEKRFFLRAFLTGIKLDPENAEGEARFVLLPGMQKLLQEPMSSRLFRALPHEKDPSEADRSSRSFIALQGIEPWFGG